jgi:hypothetical protein
VIEHPSEALEKVLVHHCELDAVHAIIVKILAENAISAAIPGFNEVEQLGDVR